MRLITLYDIVNLQVLLFPDFRLNRRVELINSYTYWPTSNRDLMNELLKSPVAKLIEGMQKGTKLLVVPLSVNNGDDITAIGTNCSFLGESFVELNEPFQGYLEEFDGETLRIRNEQYCNLKVSVADIKSAMELSAVIGYDGQIQ